MDATDVSGHLWREGRSDGYSIERDRDALARLIASDADPFELELYEWASDPQARFLDRARRSRLGQYRRRLRRSQERAKRGR
ncbi:hypothetical protein HT134_27785 [Nonomuraea rhodomycinica]|uniref:Uncharacterized protein n=2 Tax=Nonomuraea rhodomycinica TaxID=1712872 RepID=A0A7Y6ITN4_9ACTN|nr:hypothetical protein [Nonomuraea rhodomycinica]